MSTGRSLPIPAMARHRVSAERSSSVRSRTVSTSDRLVLNVIRSGRRRLKRIALTPLIVLYAKALSLEPVALTTQ